MRSRSSLNLDGGVVAQVQIVVLAVGRVQVHGQQNAGRLLFDVHALQLHLLGQLRHGQRDAVLHQHLGHVQVGAQLEGDGERVAAVVGALRRHVDHAFDAVDLLFDGRRHAVGHDLAVGAGIAGRYLHRGRRDVGILRDGERDRGHTAQQQNDNGDDPGENWALDKELGKHGGVLGPVISPMYRSGAGGNYGPSFSGARGSTFAPAVMRCNPPTTMESLAVMLSCACSSALAGW